MWEDTKKDAKLLENTLELASLNTEEELKEKNAFINWEYIKENTTSDAKEVTVVSSKKELKNSASENGEFSWNLF